MHTNTSRASLDMTASEASFKLDAHRDIEDSEDSEHVLLLCAIFCCCVRTSQFYLFTNNRRLATRIEFCAYGHQNVARSELSKV